jgi:hypothetical protein
MSRLLVLNFSSFGLRAGRAATENSIVPAAKICREKHDPQKRKSFPLKRWD